MELILDIDGVLVDTDLSYTVAAIRAARDLGARERTPEDVFRLRSGGGFNDDYDIALEFLRRDGIIVPRQRVIDIFQEHYLGSGWREGTWDGLISAERLLPSPATLDWIRGNDYSFFTGRPRDEALYVIKRLGLSAEAGTLVGMHDVEKGKPDPAGLRLILRNESYRAPLACGDTLDDLRAARAAAIPFVGILPPGPVARGLMEQAFRRESIEYVPSLDDLPALVGRKTV
ncbi:MAG: HAD family hydrolase [Planctomycetota bacterium]